MTPPLLLCVALLGAAPSGEVAPPPDYQAVAEFVQAAIDRGEAPSAAVAVVKEGQVIWAQGFGVADLEAGRAATADSIYLLASISKPIVATGLMTLVDQGLLQLDQPANELLPGAKLRSYRGEAEDITLRRLANHTAGLAEHWSFFYEPTEPPPFDLTVQRYGFAHRAPGSGWEYSNLAFGVLQHIMQSTANEEWGEYLVNNVFDPLGMSHSGAEPRADDHASAQYVKDLAGRFVRLPRYDFDHPGASAIWSSAHDLATFARLHMFDGELDGTRVLSAESAAEMRVKRAALPDGGRCGVSWFVTDRMGHACLTHSGGMPGVSTLLRVYPELDAAVVVLTNSSGHRLTRDVEKQIDGVLFAGSRPASSGDDDESEPPMQDFGGTWKGRLVHFRGDLDLRLEVDASASQAHLSLGAGERFELEDVEVRGGELRGSFGGWLEAHEHFQGEARCSLRLRKDGEDGLAGVCISYQGSYAARPHFVELSLGEAAAPPVALSFYARPDAPTVGFALPASWEEQTPENRMRLAQYTVDEAELSCVVYFFGAGGGGGVQANIDRWVGQFETSEEPSIEELKITGRCSATLVDVKGRYVAAVTPGGDERNDQAAWRMLGAVLEVPGGPLFVKMVGPEDRIAAVAEDWHRWIRSFQEVDRP